MIVIYRICFGTTTCPTVCRPIPIIAGIGILLPVNVIYGIDAAFIGLPGGQTEIFRVGVLAI